MNPDNFRVIYAGEMRVPWWLAALVLAALVAAALLLVRALSGAGDE